MMICSPTALDQLCQNPAADETVGQMIEKIADPRQAQLFERTRQAGTDALETFGTDKQRVQSLGTHGALLKARADLARARPHKRSVDLRPALS
jgi:hypothetical protein